MLVYCPGGMGKVNGKIKMRKWIGWDTDNLITKTKAAHKSKE